MKPDHLAKASKKLAELELKIIMEGVSIDVLWFRVMFCENEWCISRHMHSSYEFHFIHSGKCLVKLDDSQFQVKAGEFYLTAPGVNHEQRGSGSQLVEFCLSCDISSNSSGSEFEKLVSVLADSPCKAYKDTAGIDDLFLKALDEADTRKPGFLTNIKNLVIMLITSSARSMMGDTQLNLEVPVKSAKNGFQFQQLTRFINDNILLSITVEDIANHLHISSRQLWRLTSQNCGQSPKELIISSKLKKARQLLIETDLSIKEISSMLGFSSEYYFSQFFKREEGYSAVIFRNNIRNVRKY